MWAVILWVETNLCSINGWMAARTLLMLRYCTWTDGVLSKGSRWATRLRKRCIPATSFVMAFSGLEL